MGVAQCRQVRHSCEQNCVVASKAPPAHPEADSAAAAAAVAAAAAAASPPAADVYDVKGQNAVQSAQEAAAEKSVTPRVLEPGLPEAPSPTPATNYAGSAGEQQQLHQWNEGNCSQLEAAAGILDSGGASASPGNHLAPMQEEPEPAPEELPRPTDSMVVEPEKVVEGVEESQELEEGEVEYDANREMAKAGLCVVIVCICFVATHLIFTILGSDFSEPVCPPEDSPEARRTKMCEACGGGGYFLPVYGELEQSLPNWLRGLLYFIGLLWVFMGIGVVCDQFMGAIEQITSAEKVRWIEVHKGAKHKFHVKVWNATVANLTLMALGSSAPEILLNVVEICGSDFFAGELGPSTIVGSAAFNLLVITAVCVSALPAPETRLIEGTSVFIVTASLSVFAYIWLVVILQMITPNKVDFWEALLTLAFFPILIITAFIADKGYFDRFSKKGKERGFTEEDANRIKAQMGQELPIETIQFLLEQEAQKEVPERVSKAKVRAAMREGNKNHNTLTFGFKEKNVSVFENAGTLLLKVAANKEPGAPATMRYNTRDGSATSGARYTKVEGELNFGPYQLEKTIEVPIIDNEVWEANEDFFVELSELQVANFGRPGSPRGSTGEKGNAGGAGMNGSPRLQAEPFLKGATCKVTILNDDVPGQLAFDTDVVYAAEGSCVTIGVNRTRGVAGRITCRYRTEEGSAIAGRDFHKAEGTLTFEHGEAHQTIEVRVCVSSDHFLEKDELFRVVLDDASHGVKFDKDTDGGETSAICDVVIPGKSSNNCGARIITCCYDRDRCVENWQAWGAQFVAAMYCNGDAAEQSQAGAMDWFSHGLCLFWKVLFAFVPPPGFMGGWLCFWCALSMIGLVTAVVGDMAGLLGCCIGIPDDITAITLVALGTSLPDTFASKVAAQQNDTADDSVGNVTGSNCVNVFLGLGLPWTIGAAYWQSAGPTDDWKKRLYKDESFASLFFSDYPSGGFIVPAGSLVFSVIVFSSCAICCIGLLYFRRQKYGGELGGPKSAQNRDSVILCSLWGVYIVVSIVNSLMAS